MGAQQTKPKRDVLFGGCCLAKRKPFLQGARPGRREDGAAVKQATSTSLDDAPLRAASRRSSRRDSTAAVNMNASTTEFLTNLSGFLKCRDAVDATALRCLPNAYMSQVASFCHEEHMRQQRGGGASPRGYDDICKLEAAARPAFEATLRKIIASAGLDADAVAMHDGQPLMIDKKTPFKQLTIAPIKGRGRSEEKVANE